MFERFIKMSETIWIAFQTRLESRDSTRDRVGVALEVCVPHYIYILILMRYNFAINQTIAAYDDRHSTLRFQLRIASYRIEAR